MMEPQQLEIQYFWPLTEQLDLPLDFSRCTKASIYTPTTKFVLDKAKMFDTAPAQRGIPPQPTVLLFEKQPNLLRRCIYSIMGIKWRTIN